MADAKIQMISWLIDLQLVCRHVAEINKGSQSKPIKYTVFASLIIALLMLTFFVFISLEWSYLHYLKM